MGNHYAGNAMGKSAESLSKIRRPGQSAIELLDAICEPYHGCDAEFEAENPKKRGQVHPDFGDWTEPHLGAALGMLMVEAFAPNGVADLERYRPAFDGRDDEAALDAWYAEVYDKFKARYEFC